jgi:hypothetical protein
MSPNLLVFYVPKSHLHKVKMAIFDAGGGRYAGYSECSFEVKGIGQFRPLKGTRPFIGNKNRLSRVAEYRVDVMVESKNLKRVVAALKRSHPYEVPSFFILKSQEVC